MIWGDSGDVCDDSAGKFVWPGAEKRSPFSHAISPRRKGNKSRETIARAQARLRNDGTEVALSLVNIIVSVLPAA